MTTRISELPATLRAYVTPEESAAGEVEVEELDRRRRAAERFAEHEAHGKVSQRMRDGRRPDMVTTAVRA